MEDQALEAVCFILLYGGLDQDLEALCFMVVLQNQVLLEEKKTFLLWLYIVSQYYTSKLAKCVYLIYDYWQIMKNGYICAALQWFYSC